jgi:putative Mg2+ transporter-C (MgtC) family protein
MNPAEVIGLKDLILRLTIALLVGGTLGLNRELHARPAGVRTHALVSLGAALAAVIMLQTQAMPGGSDANAIGRIIQGVMTGIGFLGAGVILRDAGGHVTGLTTAATIWVCAALGIACGLGYWKTAGVSIALALIVLVFGQPAERVGEWIFKRGPRNPPGSAG